MKTVKFIALLFVVCLSAVTICAGASQKNSALHSVQKIYVEEMGTSTEAVRFRLLLEDQLAEKGFTVVSKTEQADAILGGAVSVARSGFFGGPADISVTARLTSPDGARLWSANMGGQIIILNPIKSLKFKEPIEYRAKELVKKLRGDWKSGRP